MPLCIIWSNLGTKSSGHHTEYFARFTDNLHTSLAWAVIHKSDYLDRKHAIGRDGHLDQWHA